MVLSVHVLAGAVIAAKTQNPILGLLFAFLSHYLIDIIPHQEYSIYSIKNRRWKNSSNDFLKVFLDIFVGFFLIIVFLKNYSWPVLGGFSAILPDTLTFLHFVFPKIKPLNILNEYHEKIHWFKNSKIKIPLFWGIFSQAIIISLSIYLLRF